MERHIRIEDNEHNADEPFQRGGQKSCLPTVRTARGGSFPQIFTSIADLQPHGFTHNVTDLRKPTKVLYAKAITKLQYLCRMDDATLKRDQKRLKSEQENPGYANWDLGVYTDWILSEIDANIHIREVQVKVALKMIFPTSSLISVLQMNIEQGKTSVIMPMVACVLADRGDAGLNSLIIIQWHIL
jgi:hypothetical protein